MNPVVIASFVSVAFASFYLGAQSKTPVESTPQNCPPPVKCPVCELNVTGIIHTEKELFSQTKEVRIYFNGIEGISGVLDKNNNGHFVGNFKGKSAEAICSGADNLTCAVKFGGKETSITFDGK